MRFLPFILTALVTLPAAADVYTYDYAGHLDSNSWAGSANDTFHGTLSFHTDMPLWYVGTWGEPGDTAYYWDRLVTGLAPHYTFINLNAGITVTSSNEYARIQITNDHYMYGDFFILYSSYLQSTGISIPPSLTMAISLRGVSADPIASLDIPHGLPPLDAFEAAHLLLNGSGVGVITSMMHIPTGDLDRDGFVGITDLNIILGSWNQVTQPGGTQADPSGDGFVGIEDLNLVLGNWNVGTPPQTFNPNVPEPYTAMLLLIALPVICTKRS